jgi:hypothetical protein
VNRRSNIERYFDTIDGKKLVRFDHYIRDALDKKILIHQLWADPSTHLPVHIRSKLPVHEQRQQNREYIMGEFHFPSTGPVTIYDLGVPVDLEVINRRKLEDSTSSEATEILQASRKASEDFPSQYLAIIWESGTQQVQVGEVDVIYRNDHKIHVSVYVNMPALKNSDLPTASDEVLRWTRNQQPLSVTIFDGEKEYRQSNILSLDSASQPEVYVHRTKWPMLKLQLWFRLKHRFWPHVDWAKGRHSEIAANHPETPAGCICLLEGDKYFFVDPDKDYLCIGKILMKTMDAHSHEYNETTWWSDLSQLPTGHWYPRKEHLASFPDPERGISGHERDWNINIQLLSEEEFPPHVFDGEKLLEGAKVETY